MKPPNKTISCETKETLTFQRTSPFFLAYIYNTNLYSTENPRLNFVAFVCFLSFTFFTTNITVLFLLISHNIKEDYPGLYRLYPKVSAHL